jgi:very-short-patch-repair endonuclease
MRTQVAKDGEIAALAGRQYGVVSRAQLLALGLSGSAIGRRVRGGRLHPVHRGVYAVGHASLTREARYLAAVLASGPGAVLSHVAAAQLWDLRPSSARAVDVIVPVASRGVRRPGVRAHRSVLRAGERTVHRRIAVTTPARTLLDLAHVLPTRALHRALDRAEALRVFDLDALRRVADGRPGTAALRAALGDHDAGTTLTRSEFEERLLEVCARHGLPRPLVNTVVCGLEVDTLFADARVVVEADGYAHHGTRAAFERDRARDRRLAVAGYRVLRVTHRALTEDPEAFAAELRHLVGDGGGGARDDARRARR